jgi:hypothetical protein
MNLPISLLFFSLSLSFLSHRLFSSRDERPAELRAMLTVRETKREKDDVV